jgi:hypothetical protein
MVVARVLGGRDDALIFRRMLTEVTHPNDTLESPLWARIWDALFDEYMGPQINRPEDLGPILHNRLGIDLQPPKE